MPANHELNENEQLVFRYIRRSKRGRSVDDIRDRFADEMFFFASITLVDQTISDLTQKGYIIGSADQPITYRGI